MMANTITPLFFELIQISVGTKKKFAVSPTADQWPLLLDMAIKQSLAGVLLEGMAVGLPENRECKPIALYEWIGVQQQIIAINRHHTKKTKELSEWFKELGYKSCILKGQGVGRLYPNPELRQPGDLDIWVDVERDVLVAEIRSKGIDVSCVDYVNCHAAFFHDIEVEVHFRPTYLYNPFANKKLQRWLEQNKQGQMKHEDREVGYSYPAVSFNLVFCMIHIYRHIFSEGIGLRQLMDYFYILSKSTENERKSAFETLISFRLEKFVASVMYVQQVVFNIDDRLLLCAVNEKEGKILLSEILRGGDFGKYDDRINFVPDDQKWKRGLNSLKRDIRFITHYPGEVLWMPLWKAWHWGWRKWNGYL